MKWGKWPLLIILVLSGVPVCAAEWEAIGPGGFGAGMAVAFHPEKPGEFCWGTDMGALFITRDDGCSWEIAGKSSESVPGYRGAWNALYDPRNPQILWCASEHGVFRSANGGRSWKRTTDGVSGEPGAWAALGADPEKPGVFYAAQGWVANCNKSWSHGRVFRTADDGHTWKELTSPAGNQSGTVFSQLLCHGKSVYICGNSGFFRSDDEGRSWHDLRSGFPFPPEKLRFSNLIFVGDMLLVSVAPFRHEGRAYGGIYRRNAVGKFEPTAFNTYAKKQIAVMANYNDTNHGSRVLPIFMVNSKAAPQRLYAGGTIEIGLHRSDDAGKTWRSILQSNVLTFKGIDRNGRIQYFVSTKDSGNVQNAYFYGIDAMRNLAVSDADPDRVAFTDNRGLMLSRDGGKSWRVPYLDYHYPVAPGKFDAKLPTPLTHALSSRGPQFILPTRAGTDPHDPQVIYASYQDHGFRVSRDGGKSWETPTRGLEYSKDVGGARSYTCDREKPGRVYFTSRFPDGRAFVSEDYGRSFTSISLPETADKPSSDDKSRHSGIVIDYTSPVACRTLYMSANSGVWKSTDAGRNWRNITPPELRPSPKIGQVVLDPRNSQRLFVSSHIRMKKGLFESTDAGTNWRRVLSNDVGAVTDLIFAHSDPRKVYLLATPPGDSYSFWTPRSLYRSDDGGKNWKELNSGPGIFGALGVDPGNADVVFSSRFFRDLNTGKPQYLRSTDGGKSWKSIADDIPVNGNAQSITVEPDRVYFCDSFTIYRHPNKF